MRQKVQLEHGEFIISLSQPAQMKLLRFALAANRSVHQQAAVILERALGCTVVDGPIVVEYSEIDEGKMT